MNAPSKPRHIVRSARQAALIHAAIGLVEDAGMIGLRNSIVEGYDHAPWLKAYDRLVAAVDEFKRPLP